MAGRKRQRSVYMISIEKYINYGVKQIFCTDVSKDGKLEGPSIELYKRILLKFPELYFVASGGVSSVEKTWKH